MKLAQMLATVPDLLPPEYAAELQTLQVGGAADGAGLRQAPDAWRSSGRTGRSASRSSSKTPAAAASLGQVHRAVGHDGRALACKLQYPDMQSAVEADLCQLGVLLALQRRFNPEIDTTEIAKEIGERLREELDYEREAGTCALYRHRCSATSRWSRARAGAASCRPGGS